MKKRILLLSLPLLMAAAHNAGAVSFGTFDPRSMAMGGAGTASGTSANASFYNPALLATARSKDDFSLELPVIGLRIADPDKLIKNLDDFQKANYDTSLTTAVDHWNAANSASDAAALLVAKDEVVAAAGNMINGLQPLSNKALQGDLNVGMVIGIPSKKWGTALFVNSRAIGGALLDITQSDLDSFNALVTGLQTNNLTGLVDPVTGNLLNPVDTMTSSVEARGAVISEAGISLAREFMVAGHSMAFGITPKFMKVDTFDYRVDVNSGDVTVDQGKKSYSNANLDLGVAHDYGNNWKTGIVVKDLLSKSYTTVLGNSISLKPQARFGVAYTGSVATTALDVDLTKNRGTGFDYDSQFVALGAELNGWDVVQFRVGYRHNLSRSNTDSASLGVGLSPFGIHLDLAVVGSNNEIGVGLQTGFRF